MFLKSRQNWHFFFTFIYVNMKTAIIIIIHRLCGSTHTVYVVHCSLLILCLFSTSIMPALMLLGLLFMFRLAPLCSEWRRETRERACEMRGRRRGGREVLEAQERKRAWSGEERGHEREEEQEVERGEKSRQEETRGEWTKERIWDRWGERTWDGSRRGTETEAPIDY